MVDQHLVINRQLLLRMTQLTHACMIVVGVGVFPRG
jgi:hypothetical protein